MKNVLSTLACLLLATSSAQAEVSFIRDVAPILLQRCSGCHGPKITEGDYRLHTFEYLMQAGASELPPIVAGEPEESELYLRLIETVESLRMPQQDNPLAIKQIELIRRWIAEGARFDGSDPTAPLQTILPPRQHSPAPEVYRVPVPVFAIAFSPDGKELAVGGYHEVTIWSSATGDLLRRIGQLPQRIQALAYSDDGSKLLIGGGSPGEYGELTLCDVAERKKLRTYGTFADIVLGVAISSDGLLVAAGSADRSARVYERQSAEMLWKSQVHSDWITGISFSPEGRFLATSSRDLTVKVHEVQTGRLYTTYNGHQRQYGQYTGRFAVYDVVFAPEAGKALSVGEGRAIRVWEPERVKSENGTAADMEQRFAKSGHTRYIEHGHTETTFKLAVAAGQAFSASADGSVRQHDLHSGQHIRTYLGHADWVFAVDYHAATRRAASGAFDGEVRIWDTETGRCLRAFPAAPGYREPTVVKRNDE